MEAIIEKCAGLDVHEATVVACVLCGNLNGKPHKEIVTFSTTTKELLKLTDWLEEKGCTHVAMESTGVYWKPVWNILANGKFELILANARHIKNLPGRKTDIMDSEWIAKLLRSGLIKKSFVPEEAIRELRDITRYRKKILYEINREKNRIHKILEDCNIKIACYVSDLFGDTGTKIIQKIINGEKITFESVFELTSGRGKSPLRKKINDIYESLNGDIKKHHIMMIKYSYDHLIFLQEQLESIEKQIEEYIKPYKEEVAILDSIPGINQKAAAVIIAEIGADMNFLPTDKHLTSWAGLSPGNNESAGKKKRAKARDGNKNLKSILCECAWAAKLSKNTRLSICYNRWVKRMGQKKAIIALASLMLRICYQLLSQKQMYVEYGVEYGIDLDKKKEEKMIRLLEARGYNVEKQ